MICHSLLFFSVVLFSVSVIDDHSDDDNMLVVPKGESDDETENTSNEAMFPL